MTSMHSYRHQPAAACIGGALVAGGEALAARPVFRKLHSTGHVSSPSQKARQIQTHLVPEALYLMVPATLGWCCQAQADSLRLKQMVFRRSLIALARAHRPVA